MKYTTAVGLSSDVNKEIENGARVVLIVPFLKTDNWGSFTAGYNVLFEKEDEENWRKSLEDEIARKNEKIKSLKAELDIKAESKSNTSELKPCPFCGTKVEMRRVPLWNGSHGYHGCFNFEVKCPKCGCSVNYIGSDTVNRSEEEAIANVTKAWNSRKENLK